MKVMEASFIDP